MIRTGIDVSRHQGKISWNKVKGNVDFAIIRAGYGKSIKQKDPRFESNYAGATAAGIPVGVYWYSYAKTPAEAKREALACKQVIKGKRFEYPVYFDIEDKTQSALGKQTLTAICKAFCEEMEEAGYFVGVYANTDWFTNKLDYPALSKAYTIWLADYRTNYNRTLRRDMHQYTSEGTVPGIVSNVDMDTCTRNFPAIMRKAGLNGCK